MTPERALRSALGAASAVLLLGVACGEAEHPPPLGNGVAGESGRDAGVVVDGMPSDAPATCGGERIQAIVAQPKIFFVLDRSGSMSSPITASGTTKYQAAWSAVGELLRTIGHRVEYGAALFPDESGLECGGVHQIFPTTPGDPLGSAGTGQNGPRLQDLMDRFAAYSPGGGTPTAAAILGLRPTLEALGERVHVVLATDGAPNCNPALTCAPNTCIPDLEEAAFGGERCGSGISCCDEAVVGPGAGGNCIDGQSVTNALGELRAAGVPTYVIGMPGSEIYAGVLSAMAEAGGTARPSATPYYAISDAAALKAALFEIGTGIAIDCDLELATVPPEQDLVNVYFDGHVVPYDPDAGWEWTGDDSLSLRGAACATLSSGGVLEVQIVYGCRTVVR